MKAIHFKVSSAGQEGLLLDLIEHGTTGILEQESGWIAFFEEQADVSELIRKHGGSPEHVAEEPAPPLIDGSDWDPILVGERFVIAPSGVEVSRPAERLRLTVDATTAFGTGRHESTQMMLEVLETIAINGKTVLDIGSGSGILCLASTLLEAGRVFGCDIHFDGMVDMKGASLFVGSADCVLGQVADIVLANISAKILDRIAADLRRVTKPDGILVISGFLGENPPKRFRPERVVQKGEWQCWICRPDAVDVSGAATDGRHPAQWW